MSVPQELKEITDALKKEKEQEQAQPEPDCGDTPQAPFLPRNDDEEATKDQAMNDNLTTVTNIIKEAAKDDPSGREHWVKQAERLVRQYCRLAVIPKTESAVIEELR